MVTHILQDATQEEIKQLFTVLTAQTGVAVLLGGRTAAGAFLMFGCNKTEKRVDVRAAFKDAIAAIGGKGGGSACFAQGFGPDGTQLSKAVETACEMIKKQLDN